MITCSWTMCCYCKDIKNTHGVCNHVNEPDKMIAEGKIKVKNDCMIHCKLYSSSSINTK